ncbi:MAG: 50S ribosomal protein L21 [Chloroflexi bacterium]|nr:50S ribosomal protein L21 [Chloroflexota bacterium]
MYAVIETAGKQYRVELGTQLEVDRMDADPGQTVQLDRVLLIADGEELEIGRPLVAGAVVAADVVRLDRGEKIVVFKYGPKTRRRVKQGHRQDLTILRIADISWGGRSAAADAQATKDAERRAAAEADREAAKRAAADKDLAAKLAAEADSESGTDAGAATAATGTGAVDTARSGTRSKGRAKSTASTSKSTASTSKTSKSSPSTKATPRAPASRTQAPPAPEEGAKKRRTTKKDE